MNDGPKRLAFCITELDPGGAERALLQIVRRLDRDQWEPAVFCLSGHGQLADDFEAVGIPVTFLNARGQFDLPVINRLRRALKQWQPELLQCFLYHANLTGRVAGWMAGVPRIVCGIRVAERRGRLRLWIDRTTQGMVDRHVCVSQAVADFSMKQGGLKQDRVVVIPNGVEVDVWSGARAADLSPWGILPESHVVLFVGRLDPQKRPDLLLDAVLDLLPGHERLHVLLVGEGPMRVPLQQTIDAHDVRDRVHLAGRLDNVPEIMKASTCLVLPSDWEGMPNVVLEAMASGLPVIATAVEGVAELIEDRRTGLIVKPDSAPQIRSAIQAVLEQSMSIRGLVNEAQHVVSKRFTWDSVVDQYQTLYRRLLEN